MKLKNILCIASLLVLIGSVAFAHNTEHYDHATLHQPFNPDAMVTICTDITYLPRYQITNYTYIYGDGTKCLVQVDRAGIVHSISVTNP